MTPLEKMAKQLEKARANQPRVTLKQAQAQARRFRAACKGKSTRDLHCFIKPRAT